MKLAFAGTPEFAAVILDALAGSRHTVEVVFTRPDASAGRGRRITESAVKRHAAAAVSTSASPARCTPPKRRRRLPRSHPMRWWSRPTEPCCRLRSSPYPGSAASTSTHRSSRAGAARPPVHHAILAGDRCTGVSIMQMDTGLDTGPVLATRACAISPEDTTGSLTRQLAELGAATLVDTLHALEAGTAEARPQDETCATLAPRLSKSQAVIDWARPAAEIERMIRAFEPLAGRAYPSGRRRRAGVQDLAREACRRRIDPGAGRRAPMRRSGTAGRDGTRRPRHHRASTAGGTTDVHRGVRPGGAGSHRACGSAMDRDEPAAHVRCFAPPPVRDVTRRRPCPAQCFGRPAHSARPGAGGSTRGSTRAREPFARELVFGTLRYLPRLEAWLALVATHPPRGRRCPRPRPPRALPDRIHPRAAACRGQHNGGAWLGPSASRGRPDSSTPP